MKKQIEEMAKIMCRGCSHKCDDTSGCIVEDYAEAIYNEGYRKQEWISVEERLPEKNYHDFVLAWNGLHVVFLHYSHRYKQWEDYYSLKEHPWKVTHWMPLPEPPKRRMTMARYIDTQKVTVPSGFFNKNLGVPDLLKWLEAQPAADVVPVVRCKNCTEWDEKEQECSHWYGFRENDFCSHGKKKGGAE